MPVADTGGRGSHRPEIQTGGMGTGALGPCPLSEEGSRIQGFLAKQFKRGNLLNEL